MSKEQKRGSQPPSKLQVQQDRWRMAGLSPEDIATQTARFLEGEQQRAADPFHKAAKIHSQPQDHLEGLTLSRGVKQFVEKARTQGVEENDLQARLGIAALETEGMGRKKITMKRLRSTTS